MSKDFAYMYFLQLTAEMFSIHSLHPLNKIFILCCPSVSYSLMGMECVDDNSEAFTSQGGNSLLW